MNEILKPDIPNMKEQLEKFLEIDPNIVNEIKKDLLFKINLAMLQSGRVVIHLSKDGKISINNTCEGN